MASNWFYGSKMVLTGQFTRKYFFFAKIFFLLLLTPGTLKRLFTSTLLLVYLKQHNICQNCWKATSICIMHLSASITLYVYRYDNRDGSHSHWSDDTILRGRASFEKAATEKAKLTINNVQYEDHSVYKCRVDFKMAPTSISSISLKVIGKDLFSYCV